MRKFHDENDRKNLTIYKKNRENDPTLTNIDLLSKMIGRLDIFFEDRLNLDLA